MQFSHKKQQKICPTKVSQNHGRGFFINEQRILRISPYSVRMRENTNQNNSEHRHFLRSEMVFLTLPKELQLTLFLVITNKCLSSTERNCVGFINTTLWSCNIYKICDWDIRWFFKRGFFFEMYVSFFQILLD